MAQSPHTLTFIAQIVPKALKSHKKYANTLPSFCAAHSLHTAQLVSLEQWDDHSEQRSKQLWNPPVDRHEQQGQRNLLYK